MLAHVQQVRAVLKRRTGCVRRSSKFISKLPARLFVLGALCAIGGTGANAQNLDQGKSAIQLFNESCAACHRGAAGLARGRSRTALFQFLQEHYSSSSTTAAELAAYLASVDRPQGGRSRPAAVNPAPPVPQAQQPAPRTHGPRSVHTRQRHPSDRIQTEKPPTGPAAGGRSFP
jgi:hypothetical protein